MAKEAAQSSETLKELKREVALKSEADMRESKNMERELLQNAETMEEERKAWKEKEDRMTARVKELEAEREKDKQTAQLAEGEKEH